MLTQRTRVHSVGQRRSVFLAWHHFELWPSTHLVCLVLKITRAASGTPASDPDSKRNLQLQPNVHHVFLARIWPFSNLLCKPFPRLFPLLLQFDLWKTFFADLSTRRFPFLLEFDLWTTYFAEPPRAFFSSGDYSTALSKDFDTVQWPSGDFVTTFTFSLLVDFWYVPTVLSRYGVKGAYCFLFRCSIFFCV